MKALFIAVVLVLLSHQAVLACSAVQLSGRDLDELIEKTSFIGLARIIDTNSYDSGNKKSVVLSPFMVYRADKDFDLLSEVEIEFEDGWTSCDKRLNEKLSYQEVVILKNESGKYTLGDRMVTGNLGPAWETLRSQVRYVHDRQTSSK